MRAAVAHTQPRPHPDRVCRESRPRRAPNLSRLCMHARVPGRPLVSACMPAYLADLSSLPACPRTWPTSAGVAPPHPVASVSRCPMPQMGSRPTVDKSARTPHGRSYVVRDRDGRVTTGLGRLDLVRASHERRADDGEASARARLGEGEDEGWGEHERRAMSRRGRGRTGGRALAVFSSLRRSFEHGAPPAKVTTRLRVPG